MSQISVPKMMITSSITPFIKTPNQTGEVEKVAFSLKQMSKVETDKIKDYLSIHPPVVPDVSVPEYYNSHNSGGLFKIGSVMNSKCSSYASLYDFNSDVYSPISSGRSTPLQFHMELYESEKFEDSKNSESKA